MKKIILTFLLTIIVIFSFAQEKKQFTISGRNPDVYKTINNEYTYINKFWGDLKVYFDFENNIFSISSIDWNDPKNYFGVTNYITAGRISVVELYNKNHKLVPPKKISKAIMKDELFRYMIYTTESTNGFEYVFLLNYKMDYFQIIERQPDKTYLFFIVIDKID
jgi:hypothetical protein